VDLDRLRAIARRPVLARLRHPWPDDRAERVLGAVSLIVCAVVVAMIAFVAVKAWPTFEHDGLSWLGPGGKLKDQFEAMQATGTHPPASAYRFNAWPIVYGTLLTTALAVVIALPLALFASIFIVELAPRHLRAIAIPVIRLLASVPSVVYGLIGVLVLAPFVGNHIITGGEKAAAANEVQLTGESLGVTVVILALMIAPIMVALICEALVAVPKAWREGAVALGLNPLRAILAVVVRAARPRRSAPPAAGAPPARGAARKIAD